LELWDLIAYLHGKDGSVVRSFRHGAIRGIPMVVHAANQWTGGVYWNIRKSMKAKMKSILTILLLRGSTAFVRILAPWHRRFRNFISALGRTPLDEWSARRKGLYLHRTTQHWKTRTNILALSEIRTHGLSVQEIKARATGTGSLVITGLKTICVVLINCFTAVHIWNVFLLRVMLIGRDFCCKYKRIISNRDVLLQNKSHYRYFF
jgi:hypothetical protein